MGWLLCVAGLVGLVPVGDLARIGAGPGESWQVPVFAAGLILLLVDRDSIAYGVSLVAGGGFLSYVDTAWPQASGWAVDAGIIGVTMVVCGIGFSSSRLSVNGTAIGGACLLAVLLWGGLWTPELLKELPARYEPHLPLARELALDAVCVTGSAWLLNKLRSDDPIVRARLLFMVGLTLTCSELALSWVLPQWRAQLLIIGVLLVVFGLAIALISGFVQERYGLVAFVALVAGAGGRFALNTWSDVLHLTELHLRLADVFMAGMLVVTGAALATAVIDGTVEISEELSPSRELFLRSSHVQWAAIGLIVVPLTVIASFDLPREISGLLTVVAAASCLLFFVSVWASVLLVVDSSFREAMRGAETPDMWELWFNAVVRGPRDFGDGPFLSLFGIVLIAVLSLLPESGIFPFLRLVGAMLLITGTTRTSVTIMRRIEEARRELSPQGQEDLKIQVYLVPTAVAACGVAITLMVVITADIWLVVRVMLAMLASICFVISATPLLYALAAPALRRLGLTWKDLLHWIEGWVEQARASGRVRWIGDAAETARSYAVAAVAALAVGVTSIVFGASFELVGFLEVLLVLTAVIGVALTLVSGWFMMNQIATAESRDLIARTRGFASSRRPTYRLLPEPGEPGSD
ncbi:MAG: hypothetical protein HOV86_01470 [Thermoactinospora sp.]|nr:hypothetical protein [Thermoactinospora sp.]